MLVFNPFDPVPQISLGEYSYSEEKAHSAQVDEWLGYDFSAEEQMGEIQKNSDEEYWFGLPVQHMQTPYTEIRSILELVGLSGGQSVIDLGCAYGRMAFVISRYFPTVKFTGYEFVESRVAEAKRVLASQDVDPACLIHQDLAEPGFSPERADLYFMFDFGSPDAIHKTLNDLRILAQRKPIKVIARGRSARAQIHKTHHWLGGVNEAEHFPHFSIYRS
ncbi:MAG: class I SAM-dependent methyltransferase [Bdellovibrionota bacterium]